MGCTIRTVNLRPIAERASWYMDHTSYDALPTTTKYTKLHYVQAIVRISEPLRPER